MALYITKIHNTQIRDLATKYDNGNGILEKDELSQILSDSTLRGANGQINAEVRAELDVLASILGINCLERWFSSFKNRCTTLNPFKNTTAESSNSHRSSNNSSTSTRTQQPTPAATESSVTSALAQLNQLDPQKTYIGLSYEYDYSAKTIAGYTRQYCEGPVPCHAFNMVNENGEWWVYESTLKTRVHKIKADEWLQKHNDPRSRYELYEAELDKTSLQNHIGEPYAWSQISSFTYDITGNETDYPGVICSEYSALAYDEICKYHDLPAHVISPAHIKDYFMAQNVQPLRIKPICITPRA